MDIQKVKAMLGFSIKAGKIIYGADNIEKSKKPIYLIIADSTLSKRTLEGLQRICSQKNATLISSLSGIEDMVSKKNCKVVAVLDKNMSDNIIMNAGNGGGSILD